jgi:hypothetical protein
VLSLNKVKDAALEKPKPGVFVSVYSLLAAPLVAMTKVEDAALGSDGG